MIRMWGGYDVHATAIVSLPSGKILGRYYAGGPIYDSSGNIVGVVISQFNKKTFGGLVENVNFGIKASTVRQFLVASGIN